MEHRYGARYLVAIAVYARAHAGVVSFVGQLRNVSVSGGFLHTTLPVQPLSHISLRLLADDGPFGPRLEGQVVRRDSDGVGIEWSELAPELIQTLRHNTGTLESTDHQANGDDIAYVEG